MRPGKPLRIVGCCTIKLIGISFSFFLSTIRLARLDSSCSTKVSSAWEKTKSSLKFRKGCLHRPKLRVRNRMPSCSYARPDQAAHDRWRDALACFQASLDLWNRLPLDQDDKLLGGQRRLLERHVSSAEERKQFYHVTAEDRAVYNAAARPRTVFIVRPSRVALPAGLQQ
jgi:hypothetical protein